MAPAPDHILPTSGVIIAGAGLGERLGYDLPKAFVELAGRALLLRSIDPFLRVSAVTEIVAVVPPGWEAAAAALFDGAGLSDSVRAVVPGGPARQESVARGLDALSSSVKVVLVHDAARPLVTPDLVTRVIAAAAEHGAAIPGVPLVDTIKQVEDGFVSGTPDRACLRAIQTPQGFGREVIAGARSANRGTFTDDAALVEAAGHRVCIVPGERSNLKITEPQDLAICEMLLAARSLATKGE